MPPLTPLVKKLLILNVLVFLGLLLLKEFSPTGYQLERLLSLHYPTSEYFRPHQIVTHFFMHGSLTHLFLNMFGLVMFGPLLEQRYGPKRFLILYLTAAMTAVALHFGYTWFNLSGLDDAMLAFQAAPGLDTLSAFFKGLPLEGLTMDSGESVISVISGYEDNFVLNRNLEQTAGEALVMMQEYQELLRDIPMVGASGALYGVVAAFAILYPDFKLMLIFLPIPIKARYFVPIMLAVDLFLGVMNYNWDPIAHFAHLGGALGGGLLAYYWYRTEPPAGVRRWN